MRVKSQLLNPLQSQYYPIACHLATLMHEGASPTSTAWTAAKFMVLASTKFPSSSLMQKPIPVLFWEMEKLASILHLSRPREGLCHFIGTGAVACAHEHEQLNVELYSTWAVHHEKKLAGAFLLCWQKANLLAEHVLCLLKLHMTQSCSPKS